MGGVKVDSATILKLSQILENTVENIENTKRSLKDKYDDLGDEWNDDKYEKLGEIIAECNKALNDVRNAYANAGKGLADLLNAIQKYEETSLDGAVAYPAGGKIKIQLNTNNQNEIENLPNQRSKSELVINGKTIGKPMTIDEALKGTNPNYSKGEEYKRNCQRCVQTYEYRRRGFDVEALPKKGRDPAVVWGNECFVDSNGVKPNFMVDMMNNPLMTRQAVQDELSKAPDGARYIIYIKWLTKDAHVFIAEKVNGNVRFVDPQTGANDVKEYFTRGIDGRYNMIRIDDKAFTDNIDIINKVMK